MMAAIKYIFSFALIGLLAWFSYKQIKGIVVAIKQRKAEKNANKDSSESEKKEE